MKTPKAEIRFFELFQILHFMKKYTYKLKLHEKLRIYNIFYILLFEQNSSKKKRINKMVIRLNFKVSNNKMYKIEEIWDDIVNTEELKIIHLLR